MALSGTLFSETKMWAFRFCSVIGIPWEGCPPPLYGPKKGNIEDNLSHLCTDQKTKTLFLLKNDIVAAVHARRGTFFGEE